MAEEEARGRHHAARSGRRLLPDRSARRHQGIRQPPADFTVNIALVRDGVPEVGVVFAPLQRHALSPAGRAGPKRSKSAMSCRSSAAGRLQCRTGLAPLTIVASRSHRTPETDAYIRDFGRGRDRLGRLVAEILPDRHRRGRPLSALRPNDGVGYRRRRRGPAGRRRHDRDARRRAARLWQAQPAPTTRISPIRTSSPAAGLRNPPDGRQAAFQIGRYELHAAATRSEFEPI